jgi:NADP-dependent 3-hydroxy acid dehydrogenase YdfG
MPQLVWLVTGCTSGFGEVFILEILSRGDKAIATGRNLGTRINHPQQAGASVLDLDVTISQAEIDAKIEQAIGIYGHIDVLVNNAGYVELGFVEEAA